MLPLACDDILGPSEAEWEYACRCGTTNVFCFGEDERRLGEYAWYQDNAGGTTHPVDRKRPNLWGLYDMHGNTWEWCHDWFAPFPRPTLASTDPQGPVTASVRNHRGIRGGSWNFSAADGRAAYRGHGAATNQSK
ncbi:MAG: formylglycine-generating enzyme family protein [Pirellulaceae bacterium]